MTPPLSPLAALPPLALYLHFPWCVAKCPYCDFNSHALRDALPEAQYVAALKADLAAQAPSVAGRPIVSVFLGGGTPSLFSPAAIGCLLDTARAEFEFASAAEVTMEANPGTLERGRFREYRAAGVNRVSLGAQSFGATQLTALGRIHDADDTRRAAAELHAAGLENFNLDLMYALPGQNAEQALADVEAALALAPAHLSHYQLTLEPGTRFGATPPPGLPAEAETEEMLELCQSRLAAADFLQYEISGYARPAAQCRHNLNYWRFGDYLGVGAGAHGKRSAWSREGALRIERTIQLREPRRYLAQGPAGLVRREVPAADLGFEFMMNALRLVEGFTEEDWFARTGRPVSEVRPELENLAGKGLLERRPGGWRATPRGLRFLNDVLLGFLPSVVTPPLGVGRANRVEESQGSARG